MKQQSIPFAQLRGGSSKGVYLNAKDLPSNPKERDKVILAIMEGVGKGDPRQIDGLGGADSLTSKVAVVAPSKMEGVDIDYLFIQVLIGKGQLGIVQNCGNILAGVLPFAIETGMFPATENYTTAVIQMLNSNSLCEVTIETPDKIVNYKGAAKVDGVPGTGAPVICNYLNVAGKNCGGLLPTGNSKDVVDGIEVTCVDNGMPVVVLKATDFGISGYETKAELDANENLKKQLENIRLQVGPKMNLGDVKDKTVPKMCLISPAKNGGLINTRTFIPLVCHAAIGVLGAVSAATGAIIQGSVGEEIFNRKLNLNEPVSIEHPSGEFTVHLTIEKINGAMHFKKSGVIRTARLISKGEVFIP